MNIQETCDKDWSLSYHSPIDRQLSDLEKEAVARILHIAGDSVSVIESISHDEVRRVVTAIIARRLESMKKIMEVSVDGALEEATWTIPLNPEDSLESFWGADLNQVLLDEIKDPETLAAVASAFPNSAKGRFRDKALSVGLESLFDSIDDLDIEPPEEEEDEDDE